MNTIARAESNYAGANFFSAGHRPHLYGNI